MPPADEGAVPGARSAETLAEAERGEVIVGMLGTALLVPGAPEHVAAAVLAALGGPVVQGDDGAVQGAAAQAAISLSLYTHLTLPTIIRECRSRWSPDH